jgi:hypothetical protein
MLFLTFCRHLPVSVCHRYDIFQNLPFIYIVLFFLNYAGYWDMATLLGRNLKNTKYMKFWLRNVTGLNFGKFFHHEKDQYH